MCWCFRFLASTLCCRACPTAHQKNQVLQKKKETQVGLNIQRQGERDEKGARQSVEYKMSSTNPRSSSLTFILFWERGVKTSPDINHPLPLTLTQCVSACVFVFMCVCKRERETTVHLTTTTTKHLMRVITSTSQELRRKLLIEQSPKWMSLVLTSESCNCALL